MCSGVSGGLRRSRRTLNRYGSAVVQKTDTLIVGAGPVGLEVAAALKRDAADYLHVDAGQVGQTMSWWAPGTRFFSSPERIAIAGVPLVTAGQEKATREEYLAYLRGVAGQFDLRVRTFERVEGIEAGGPSRFHARTRTAAGRNCEYAAKNIVLAIGDMHRPRMLGAPGEDLPHVSHYLREPHEYFRRRVLIVGGRNSAVEAAIRLYRAGAEVTICCRGERFDPQRIKYWLLPEMEWLIKERKVGWMPRTEVVRIETGGVRVRPVGGGTELEVGAETVLLLTGYVQDPTLFQMCGVELVGQQASPRHDPVTMQTNVPGLYVAGTATAGTQSRFRVFIENCHLHGARIAAAIAGRSIPRQPEPDENSGQTPET